MQSKARSVRAPRAKSIKQTSRTEKLLFSSPLPTNSLPLCLSLSSPSLAPPKPILSGVQFQHVRPHHYNRETDPTSARLLTSSVTSKCIRMHSTTPILLLLLLLCLVAECHSYLKFERTCSRPSSSVNWVSSPDCRETGDILLTCVSKLATCAWTSLHLNVPEQQGRAPDDGFESGLKCTLKGVT